MTEEQYVLNHLKDAKQYYVNIVIGHAVKVFKKIYKGDFYTITTADDVREFLGKWNMPNDKPLVFEDISLMTPTVQTRLLKFIEEPPMPLIILASNDNVSPIILSRCKNIVKIKSEVKYSPVSLKDFVTNKIEYENEIKSQKLEGKELPPFNTESEALTSCPEYLYLQSKIRLMGHTYNPDKYLQLLE